MRNLLDEASAAQNLDGNRLTGSLHFPVNRSYAYPAPSARAAKAARDDVRFGSKADIALAKSDVRFTPKSGHREVRLGCPLCAKSGHSQLDLAILRFLDWTGGSLDQHHPRGRAALEGSDEYRVRRRRTWL
jgi:hypothetical protein